jgi:hypothetical protein
MDAGRSDSMARTATPPNSTRRHPPSLISYEVAPEGPPIAGTKQHTRTSEATEPSTVHSSTARSPEIRVAFCSSASTLQPAAPVATRGWASPVGAAKPFLEQIQSVRLWP